MFIQFISILHHSLINYFRAILLIFMSFLLIIIHYFIIMKQKLVFHPFYFQQLFIIIILTSLIILFHFLKFIFFHYNHKKYPMILEFQNVIFLYPLYEYLIHPFTRFILLILINKFLDFNLCCNQALRLSLIHNIIIIYIKCLFH